MEEPLGPETYAAALGRLGIGVSRETRERLALYLETLKHWQRTINLVAASTLADPWRRHLLDSAQILPLLPEGVPRLADLGSGAGLPGLVLAIHRPDIAVILIEADQRKSAFLREAARRAGLSNVRILTGRIEKLPPEPQPLVTARALASLDQLLGWAAPWLAEGAVCLFHKGYRHQDELTEARRHWMIDCDVVPSVTDPQGAVLRISNVKRKQSQS
jgi:16S rRNA (guanine527-N7)-methyltransferase